MRKKQISRFVAVAVLLAITASLLSLGVYANQINSNSTPAETTAPAETPPHSEPTEPVPTEPPTEPPTEAPIETEIPTEPVIEEPTESETEPRSMFQFTPDGQLTLVDDFEYVGMDADGNVMSKQFITVQARDGSYFYIIIDRTGGIENVHFLNQVDLTDLRSAASNAQSAVAENRCICTSTCVVGHINMDCPVCRSNMTECMGIDQEPPKDGKDTDSETTSPKNDEPGTPKAATRSTSYVKLAIGVVILVGIVIFLLKGNVFGSRRKPAPPAEYDEENDDEYEEEEYEPDEDPAADSSSDDLEYEFSDDEDAEEFEDDTSLS